MATVFRTETDTGTETGTGMETDADIGDDLERLREENRRLAVTLGAFSAFIASKGMLEEAWQFIHKVHGMDDGHQDGDS